MSCSGTRDGFIFSATAGMSCSAIVGCPVCSIVYSISCSGLVVYFLVCSTVGWFGCLGLGDNGVVVIWANKEENLLKILVLRVWRSYSSLESMFIISGMEVAGCVGLEGCTEVWAECWTLSFLIVRWSSSLELGARLLFSCAAPWEATTTVGLGKVWGDEEFFALLVGLNLFLLIMRGAVSYFSSSESGEGRESTGLFPFPLSLRLVCLGTLDLFLALASSWSLLISAWSSMHRMPSGVLLTSKSKLFFMAVSSCSLIEN